MRGEGTRAVVSRSIAAFRAGRSCTLSISPQLQRKADGKAASRVGKLPTNDIMTWRLRMTVEEQVLEKLRELPLQKQEEVLAYISRLQEKTQQRPRRSLAGLWADLGVNVSEEDISQARQEMWGNFPRDVS